MGKTPGLDVFMANCGEVGGPNIADTAPRSALLPGMAASDEQLAVWAEQLIADATVAAVAQGRKSAFAESGGNSWPKRVKACGVETKLAAGSEKIQSALARFEDVVRDCT